MTYSFVCKKCNKIVEVDIPMYKYTEVKDKQKCPDCNSILVRKIEWNGSASLCEGMYGIDGKKGWNT